MKFSGKFKFCSSVTLFVTLVLLPWIALADQEVVVTWPLESGESPMSVRDRALQQGFFRAVLKEALVMLPQELSESRTVALGAFLHPRVDGLVTSYVEKGAEVMDDPPAFVLTMHVGVNGPALKKILKSAGTFYTAGRLWPYALTLSGADPAAWQELDTLQAVTGLQVVDTASAAEDVPQLFLCKSSDGLWQGTLTLGVGKEEFAGRNAELEPLWMQLWSEYFGLTAVQERVLGTVYLAVQGWRDLTGVLSFDASLQALKDSLDEEVLVRASLQRSGAMGVWKIRTTDRERLASDLGRLLSGKGLVFELSDSSGAGREQELMRRL